MAERPPRKMKAGLLNENYKEPEETKQKHRESSSTNQETKTSHNTTAENEKQEILANIQKLEQELNKIKQTECSTLQQVQHNFIQELIRKQKEKLRNYQT